MSRKKTKTSKRELHNGMQSNSAVPSLLEKAGKAQHKFEAYDQAQVDEVVTAIAWAVVNPENNQALSELAVADTGFGNVEDKISKNHRKTLGLLRDLQLAKSVGVIADYHEHGLIEIARPVGIVAAITPSTNPIATAINKAMNAVKGRNAIIFASPPKGQQSATRLIELIHVELKRVGAPQDLVQQLPTPVSREQTQELLQAADLIVATGSQKNVRAAYASGTPTFGVGTGNVPVIVDESADINDAAKKIAASKAFDYATSCSSENSLVILAAVYESLLADLTECGGVLLTATEKTKLETLMWQDGHLKPEIVAQAPAALCTQAGISRPEATQARFLMLKEQGIGQDYPFSGEKLSPVLTLYRAENFEAAFALTQRILEYQGKGHSCGIHSHNQAHILQLGSHMPVCRVIVNQAHAFATGGSFDNGLPFSLSMGCGTWGRNSFSDNLNYKHYLNITRIASTIPEKKPSETMLFDAYRKKYGI